MSDVKQAYALVEAARRDFSAMGGMGDTEVFADEIFGFHVQQAAEKLCKAWLAMLGEVYPLTHNLESLLDRLQERDGSVERFWPLTEYTPFAGRIRYESSYIPLESIDREDAMRRIAALLEMVLRQLPASDSR